MKSNQKGSSVVEILIVVVVLGLVVTVGWLVYDRQQTKSDSQKTTQASKQKLSTAKKETKTMDPYEGWQNFNNSKLKFAFHIPQTGKEMFLMIMVYLV